MITSARNPSPPNFLGHEFPFGMQPLYQIPGETFLAHIERLRRCPRVVPTGSLYSLLFLSGVHMAFRYYVAAQSGDEFLTNRVPSHHLDDGLDDAASAGFTALMRHARSRKIRELLADIHKPPFRKWPAVAFSFFYVFEHCRWKFEQWLRTGDTEINRLRVSCAMGIQALWHGAGGGFIHEMMREPFGLDSEEFAAVKAFALTRETALPEL